MQDIPFGPLLFLIVLILIPFINALLERIRRRLGSEVLRQAPPRQPAPRTFAKVPSFEHSASASEREPTAEMGEISRRSRRQFRNKIYFTSRRDLRRAIILMTVLGPCRAVDLANAERQQFPQ